ncbi:hypothetical protein [Lelliottia amnigena]|uniref:hypothetical protein n=1 Tax=Lelliottia amnigena TaxID=61646 RepID=UPI0021D8F74A|nr:hypothetical protein [Lelliottia amnigena]MCU7784883.1 hypothetical protein [Lelliottia amnigena]
MVLIFSPLVYLTGGVEHVTPLSIANYLKLPSLSALNYLFYFVVVGFLYISSLRKANLLLPLHIMVVVLFLILFRETSVTGVLFSFVSQLLIISPIIIAIGCKINFRQKDILKITNVYILYLIACVILHYVFVSYYLMVGVSLPNERAVGIFKNPNHLAVFAILTLIFFYQLSLSGFYSKNKVLMVEFLIAFVIYISGSRSAQLFFLVLVLIHSFIFNRKFFLLYLLSAMFACVFILTSDVGLEKLESLLTKRETKDIAEAGNMRITILLQMLHDFSLSEMLTGRGSGQGTAIYISNQLVNNEKVIWLDSNVNTLTYTYGPVFTVFVFLMLLLSLIQCIQSNITSAYPLLFIIYFMWFINIGEFFPIIFMLLIPVKVFKRHEIHDFNHHSKLQLQRRS